MTTTPTLIPARQAARRLGTTPAALAAMSAAGMLPAALHTTHGPMYDAARVELHATRGARRAWRKRNRSAGAI